MNSITRAVIQANRNTVSELFKNRCGLNKAHPAGGIPHEIIPRSLRPSDWWELDNMIPLCAKCHEKVHGSESKKWRAVLTKKREAI